LVPSAGKEYSNAARKAEANPTGTRANGSNPAHGENRTTERTDRSAEATFASFGAPLVFEIRLTSVCGRDVGLAESGFRPATVPLAFDLRQSWARGTEPPSPAALNISFPPIVLLFPRPSGITSSWITDVFY
jgi:hypothetical protein